MNQEQFTKIVASMEVQDKDKFIVQFFNLFIASKDMVGILREVINFDRLVPHSKEENVLLRFVMGVENMGVSI